MRPETGAAGEAQYIANPWSGGLSQIGRNDDVVLVGTGLTMVDVALDLNSRGHTGQITAVSRRGFLPLPHQDVSPYPAFLAAQSLPTTISGLMRTVRREFPATEVIVITGWGTVESASEAVRQSSVRRGPAELHDLHPGMSRHTLG